MDEQMIALGRRAVACKGWRWLPGAHWILPGTVLNGRYRGILLDSDVVPDLTDPATLGCLLALVREAWNDAEMHVMPTFTLETAEQEQAARQSLKPGERLPHEWTVYHGEQERFLAYDAEIAHGNTEAEALVAALEAAP